VIGTIDVCGTVIEVGKSPAYPAGENGNEVIIEIAKDQTVRVSGISNTVTRWLASNLFKKVTLTFDIAE